jgi:uncharacterized membrane protein
MRFDPRWLLVLLAGCAFTEVGDVTCPPEGTELTYETAGRPFFLKHCNSCHAASANDRNGAPIAFVFDTYDQVYALSERIFVRAAADNTTMPPGPDDPSQEERDALAEWIACDMPE